MRQKVILGAMALFLMVVTTFAQGQRFNDFRGFGADVPPAPQDFGGFPGYSPDATAGPTDPFAWPGQPATQGWPDQAQMPMDYQGQPMNQGNWPQQGSAGGGQQWAEQPQYQQQPPQGGDFSGFGADLPPAAPMGGMDPAMSQANPGTGGMDMNAMMGMMNNMQGGQGGQVDMNALMGMMGNMQGGQGGQQMDMSALMGMMGGGGGGDPSSNQMLQMFGQMYGVDMSQGLDPNLIQQGLANLEELQTWEGMEGMDFGPLISMLRNGGMGGQQGVPNFDPAMMQQLTNME